MMAEVGEGDGAVTGGGGVTAMMMTNIQKHIVCTCYIYLCHFN